MRFALFTALIACSGSARAQDALYVLSSSPTNPELIQLDPQTAAVISSVPVTGHEAIFGGLAIDHAGATYSIDGYNDPNSDRTFSIDRATGVGTVVGPTGHNWNFRSISVNPLTNELFGWRDNELFRIDLQTGAATSVSAVSATNLDQGTAFAISSAGLGYVTDIGSQSLFEIDLATGAATFLGHLGTSGGAWFHDMDFDSAGQLWACFSGGGIYRIDVATATAQVVFAGQTYRGLSFLLDSDLGSNYCTALPNSTGFPASIAATGSSAASSNAVTLHFGDVPAGQAGYFLAGRTQGTFNPPGSSGILCIVGNVGRYNQPQNILVGPSGSLQIDLTSIPVNPPEAAVAGDTWNFQLWYRDIGNTSNFSPGHSITFF